jgi:hypothetical protein
LYFLQPPQEKLPESAGLLDLPEYRLNHAFSSRVNGRSHLRLQLTIHPLRNQPDFRTISDLRKGAAAAPKPLDFAYSGTHLLKENTGQIEDAMEWT